MASRAVTPPSSPTRWSGSRARTSRRYASRQAPTRSPPSSRRPTTSWPRPTPTVTCPLHLLLRRRELRRINLLKLSKKSGRPQNEGVRSLRNGAKGLISLRYAGDFCARDTTERLFRQFLQLDFSHLAV